MSKPRKTTHDGGGDDDDDDDVAAAAADSKNNINHDEDKDDDVDDDNNNNSSNEDDDETTTTMTTSVTACPYQFWLEEHRVSRVSNFITICVSPSGILCAIQRQAPPAADLAEKVWGNPGTSQGVLRTKFLSSRRFTPSTPTVGGGPPPKGPKGLLGRLKKSLRSGPKGPLGLLKSRFAQGSMPGVPQNGRMRLLFHAQKLPKCAAKPPILVFSGHEIKGAADHFGGFRAWIPERSDLFKGPRGPLGP